MEPSTTSTTRRTADVSQRKVALVAGFALLLMALLAPFAEFGVLQSLVAPADATATANNIIASEGLFRSGIAAFLIVIVLDIVVAWALYALLKPVHESFAVLTAWLRLVYAAVFAYASVNLLDAVQMLGGAETSTLPPEQLHAQVLSSIISFSNGWQIGLGIFGLHLLGLGVLLFRSAHFPRFLGVLVIVSGGGYLVDSFGLVLVPDYALTVGVFTFIGEALLIPWLFWKAAKGFRSDGGSPRGEVMELPLARPAPVAP